MQNGFLLIVNQTVLDDVAPFDWDIELVHEWAEQRTHLGTVDVVDSITGRIVFSL